MKSQPDLQDTHQPKKRKGAKPTAATYPKYEEYARPKPAKKAKSSVFADTRYRGMESQSESEAMPDARYGESSDDNDQGLDAGTDDEDEPTGPSPFRKTRGAHNKRVGRNKKHT